MKKLIFSLLGICMSAFSFAQTGTENDGDEEPVPMAFYVVAEETTMTPVADLQKLSFNDGKMVVTKKDGTTTSTPLASISKMYFEEYATGIHTINGTTDFAWDGKNIKVNGNKRVKVLLPSGTLVANGTYSDGQHISLESLPTGIYIIEIGNQSFKIAK